MWENNHGGNILNLKISVNIYCLTVWFLLKPLSEWRATYAEAAEQILDSLFIGSDVLQGTS